MRDPLTREERYENFIRIREENLKASLNLEINDTIKITDLQGPAFSCTIITRVFGGYLYTYERRLLGEGKSIFSHTTFVKELI